MGINVLANVYFIKKNYINMNKILCHKLHYNAFDVMNHKV